MNAYKTMKDAQQDEVNAFPLAFAFDQKQFDEGMRKLGLDPSETDKIYGLPHTGGFYRRTDAPALHEMLERHEKQRNDAIKSDPTGDGFIFDMFNYELANHEYVLTGSLDDTFGALGLSLDEVSVNPAMRHGLRRAREAQWKETWPDAE